MWLKRCAACLLAMSVCAGSGVAHAHPGQPLATHDLWAAWPSAIWPAVGLTLSALLYARGYLAWQRRGRGLRRRGAAFAAGWLALWAATLTPLDPLSHALLSAHMVQHLLLILVAAPLLAWSAPLGPMLLGLPGRLGSALGTWWQRARLVRGAWRGLSAPLSAWALHAAALWVWHAPVLYDAALANEAAHGLEHLAFMGTALLFWWAVLHPGRHASWLAGPGGALYLFLMGLQGGLLGALMTFSNSSWYASYRATTNLWGLTPLEDQQLAGVIMWIPAGTIYMAAALGMLGAWLAALERRDEAALRQPQP